MAKCNWEPFFTEFTDKILEYKDKEKRPILFRMIGTVFSQTSYSMPCCGTASDGSELTLAADIQNLDPFSILMFIVRGPNKIKDLCPKIGQAFNIKHRFPNNFDGSGIPIPKAVNPQFCLTWYFEIPRAENDAAIEYLWNLFESVINLRDDYSQGNIHKFIELYNGFKSYVPLEWNVSSVTDLLFLIAPSIFIGLNGKCIPYIYYRFPLLKNNDTLIACTKFDGDKYLNLCKCLKTSLAQTNEMLSDLYYDCYSPDFDQNLKNATMEFLYSKGYKDKIENPKNRFNYSKVGIQGHKDQFWIWPNKNLEELNTTWYIALNDWVNNSIYLITVPAKTIKKEQFAVRSNGKTKGTIDLELKLFGDEFIDTFTKKSSNPIKFGRDFYVKFDYVVTGSDQAYVDRNVENGSAINELRNDARKPKITCRLFTAANSDDTNKETTENLDFSSKTKKSGIHTGKGDEKKDEIGKSGEELVMDYLETVQEFLGNKIIGKINCFAFGENRDDNKGFDITFNVEGGGTIYVDVKSSSRSQVGSVEFFLSSNEYITMVNKEKERAGSYYICFVDDLDNKDTHDIEIRVIKVSDIVSNKIPITYRINIEELKTI